jgi:hypothetical protein
VSFERVAFVAWHAKQLRELARAGRMMNLVADQFENVVAGMHEY